MFRGVMNFSKARDYITGITGRRQDNCADVIFGRYRAVNS
jgi:hypothetical protein